MMSSVCQQCRANGRQTGLQWLNRQRLGRPFIWSPPSSQSKLKFHVKPFPPKMLMECRQTCQIGCKASEAVGCSIAVVAVLCYLRPNFITLSLLCSSSTATIVGVPVQSPFHLHGRALLEDAAVPGQSDLDPPSPSLQAAGGSQAFSTLFGIKRPPASEDTARFWNIQYKALPWLFGLGMVAGMCIFPPIGHAVQAVFSANAAMNLGSGFVQAFPLIFFSEIGDKTFFISGLLAVKYGKLVSYCGSMVALVAMSVVAVLMGQVFHAVPPSLVNGLPLDDYAATLLFAYFGLQAFREAASMSPDRNSARNDDQLEEAQDVVEDLGNVKGSKFWPLFFSTFSLVFAAEFGDKSFLATIGLGAAQNPFSVIAGAVVGHGLATAIAVVSGSLVSRYLSKRAICLISGMFFLTFAATSFLSLLGVPLPL
eukprot:GGOE01019415.1.p1 GENE.GGOE01019415.1~~GGOE01019415.1.p1  ORF type:complete len:424 (-),score=10.63 GGOE01019415.1:138-1409(-)